jgi:hypothetical protein
VNPEQSDLKMWHEYALSLDDKLEKALRQIEEKDSEIERLTNELAATKAEFLGMLSTEELLRIRRRCELQGNERLAAVLFRALEGRKGLEYDSGPGGIKGYSEACGVWE